LRTQHKNYEHSKWHDPENAILAAEAWEEELQRVEMEPADFARNRRACIVNPRARQTDIDRLYDVLHRASATIGFSSGKKEMDTP
jgi:hypothetical protein